MGLRRVTHTSRHDMDFIKAMHESCETTCALESLPRRAVSSRYRPPPLGPGLSICVCVWHDAGRSLNQAFWPNPPFPRRALGAPGGVPPASLQRASSEPLPSHGHTWAGSQRTRPAAARLGRLRLENTDASVIQTLRRLLYPGAFPIPAALTATRSQDTAKFTRGRHGHREHHGHGQLGIHSR